MYSAVFNVGVRTVLDHLDAALQSPLAKGCMEIWLNEDDLVA
jgi:hypothetical protein